MADLIRTRQGQVKLYDPIRGLEAIVVAEASEKHWARAKDPAQLYAAIEAKLLGQAEYVVWRDGVIIHGNGPGRGHREAKKEISEQKSLLPVADPGDVVIHRWRSRLCRQDDTGTFIDDAKMAAALAVAKARSIAACELAEVDSQLIQQSLSNEHFTPRKYIDAARVALGSIDLDPASCEEANTIVGATTYYTEAEDGLTQPWHGRVFLNPPYGRLAGEFVARFVDYYVARKVSAGIVLVNSHCTDTEWFQPLWDGLLCFTDHRINFYGDEGRSGSTHGSVFAYFGPDRSLFEQAFAQFGAIIARAAP